MRNWALGIGVLALLAVAAPAQSPTWTWAGPKQLSRTSPAQTMLGGPLDAVAASTSAAGTPLIFAAGDGGIWILQSGVWTPTPEGAPITALAVGGAPGAVYAGTQTGMIASSDGGQTWTALVAAGLGGFPIRSLASYGSQLFALTSSGLYDSSDAGATWSLALAGNYASMAQQGSAILLIGAAPVELPLPLASAPLPVTGLPASWAYAAAAPAPSGGFALVLTNADSSSSLWTVTTAGAATEVSLLPPLPGEPALALAVTSDGVLWIAVSQGLWAWQPATGLSDENSGLANAAPLGLVLDTAGVMATLDDGQFASGTATAWNESSESTSKLTALVQSGGVLTAIGGGALWQSSNAGVSWSPLAITFSGGATPTALAASAGLWIGTSSGSLVAPGGTSDQVCAGPVTALAVQGTYRWVVCGAAIYRSADAGASWQQTATLASPVVALALEASWPGLVVAAGGAGLQWSEDYGTTWSSAVRLPDGGAPVTALAFDTSQTLWVATLGRGIWTASFVPPPAEVVSISAPASAAAGTAVTVQATVESGGAPDSGATVRFAASENNRSLWSSTAVTSANGVAQASFTPTQAGAVTVLVSDSANSQYQAQAMLSVSPAPAEKLILLSGAGQSEVAGDLLTTPIVTEADDAYGNPVPGVNVAFTGGQFNPASGNTGSNGQIQTQVTLPSAPGTITLTATSSGLPPLTWTETALVPPDFSLAISAPVSPVPPGQLATLTVSVTSQGGFNQPVSLLCEQPATACSISPATISPGGGASITISAPANQASLLVEVVGSSAALGRQHTVSATLSLEAFSFAAPNPTLSVTAGTTSASIPLSLIPENGLNGPVAFSVRQADGTSLPASLSPQFQPSSVALAASGDPTQVQFAMAAARAAGSRLLLPQGRRPPPWLPFAWSLVLLILAAVCLRRRRRTLAFAVLALTLAGCGGAPAVAPPPKPVAPPPQVSTYDLEVTATVDKLTASVPIILTLTTP
ncbi:MAG: hypothetical protein EPN33_04125 [Acidobacteria bacterium]|nr:MAG: hypothetical protein EPN33_04125 [Acidobacteriota bacterium]